MNFLGADVIVAAFVCLGLAMARPQWVPGRRMVVGLLVEPVLIMLAAGTNPWHLLVYRGAGAAQLVGSAGWTYGPLFWLDYFYSYLAMSVGVGLMAWWKASPAMRAQRLVVLLAGLVPLVVNMVFFAGGFGDTLDPSTLSFAVTGTMIFYAIFRQDLLTFSPVARALLIDQITDAVVVISPNGRVLDLNPAGIDLLRAMNPGAPTKLVGVPAQEVFGDVMAPADSHRTEVVVELPDGTPRSSTGTTGLSEPCTSPGT